MRVLPIILAMLLAGCAANHPSEDAGIEALLLGKAPRDQLTPEEAARIAQSPLGSANNPVRTEGPPGQRAYLMRLRCSDGRAPKFEREGSAGLSPHGSMMDVYRVVCESTSESHAIYMDMYHPGHVESRAVAGFSIETP